MSKIVSILVSLSDLPKDQIFTSQRSGKKYIRISVGERRDPDKFGNPLKVWVSNRETGERKYVGNGKVYEIEERTTEATAAQPAEAKQEENLPF